MWATVFVELSEKADVAAAYNLFIRLLAECEGDVVPSTEDTSPTPSGQVQIEQNSPIGLTCGYFWGHATRPLLLAHTHHAPQRPPVHTSDPESW